MRWFKGRDKEHYQLTPEEKADVKESVRRQIEELLVGETFWGEFSGGRRWNCTLDTFTVEELRMTVDWE